ncbi:MAG: hypothetical protein ACE5I1_10805, partial [bacterium]
NVGWWSEVDNDVPAAPIIVVSPDLESDLSRKLYEIRPPGERDLYLPVFEKEWRLRPGVELACYVSKNLWDDYQRIHHSDKR